MSASLDLYEKAGGDAAWQLWFERCAVHRVGEENPTFAEGLAAEIDSAMYGQLSKMGVTKESMNGDVPHLHFDAFFLADSTRKEAEMRKPLKQFYKDRLAAADRSLKEFVCGTIFSPSTGRIRDIARDWVCTVRGWKPHSVKGEDGKRSVIWERALEKEDASERSGGVLYRFGGRIDREALRTDIAHVFEIVASELGVEKHAVAFLFYTAAQGVSLDQPIILDVLGCKKSTAYKLQSKCMEMSNKAFREKNVATDDLIFAQELMRICEVYIGQETVEQLIGCTSAEQKETL